MPNTAVEHSILDAAIAAKKLLNKYRTLKKSDITPPIKLTALRDAGWAAGEVRKGVIDAARELTGKTIDVEQVSTSGKVVHAYVKNYPHHAHIFVVESQNYCWRRFLVAKELCHLLLSDDKNSTSNVEEVEDLIGQLINGKFDSDPNPALLVENAAYIGAVELLLPQDIEPIADELFASGKDSLEVAISLKVPRRIVEFRYQGQGREVFHAIYKEHSFNNVQFAAVMGA